MRTSPARYLAQPFVYRDDTGAIRPARRFSYESTTALHDIVCYPGRGAAFRTNGRDVPPGGHHRAIVAHYFRDIDATWTMPESLLTATMADALTALHNA